MDTIKRIELVNAYKKLLGLPLKTVSKDDGIQNQVQDEFYAFVNNQIETLMGGNLSPSAEFTGEEVSILKAMIARSKAKVVENEEKPKIVQQNVRTQQVRSDDRSRPETRPPSLQDGQPLGSRLKAKSRNVTLEDLARLEDEGPDY